MEQVILKLDALGQKLDFIQQKVVAMEQVEFLTVRESCERYKWSRTKFNELKKEGLIRVYKVKGKLLVKVSELNQMVESMAVTPNVA